ncbi:MAG: hydantoinase B/oxoprolinase family protein [Gammaproteobacteria bacterium]|nr:hydantoinase B/oxoprolinase family protein [Gammaproteobacteria bacterium]
MMVQKTNTKVAKWQFWIDRGGTFTDVIGKNPEGRVISHKLLSENSEQYKDAAIQGIRDLLKLDGGKPIPMDQIDAIKMGTTVATNALLEREGEKTLLAITEGFEDILRIGYQQRPKLFALDIQLPDMLYGDVVEIEERIDAKGSIIKRLHLISSKTQLQQAYDKGYRTIAIVLLHGYRFQQHELQLKNIAEEIGFEQISVSHEVSPLMKIVPRGDTTVVDAYLSPILRRYVNQVEGALGAAAAERGRLMFMQSNGGLTDARFFQGKDAILSGPAGGVVGMVKVAEKAGFDKLIGFDMGGTSTDVSHYANGFERTSETLVAGVRVRAPMMLIHTVAAGGGSILHFDGARYRVGPDSAGANPGPACYRNGGPLTVTDCNVMLGKLKPEFFPRVFGPEANQGLDVEVVKEKFIKLAKEISSATKKEITASQVAEGFLLIAVDSMANAIKKISVERGYDVSDYTLSCFGGAGGQHACLVADSLGMQRIHLHPFAGVLSAFGMGLADIRAIKDLAIELTLDAAIVEDLQLRFTDLQAQGISEMTAQGVDASKLAFTRRVYLRYQGSDSALAVSFAECDKLNHDFETLHKARFGFTSPEKSLIVESIQIEVACENENTDLVQYRRSPEVTTKAATLSVVFAGKEHDTPYYLRDEIATDVAIDGPAVIIEPTSTIVIEPGWQGRIREDNDLVIERVEAIVRDSAIGTDVDPVMLEVFNNLFMSVAEQMGTVLENTASSVNIKERLDFSCALFSSDGDLVANAPHVPVHLGSMSESIKTIIRENGDTMSSGDAFLINAPYNGGTHLPDITLIKPVYDEQDKEVIFYVATRGHHADIGGTVPGSAPAHSKHVSEEGILIDNFTLVSKGVFLEREIKELLCSGEYPVRNIQQNIADLKAQVAAAEKGAQELLNVVRHYGLAVVQAYMQHVQDNAEESVRRVLDVLSDSSYSYKMDDGHQICVTISVDKVGRAATIDFTGTSDQHPGNYNAPRAICQAAVLYVFRCMVDDDIPLNAGCLKPLKLIIPEHSMINPEYPAAVIAGNVETSQYIVDTLFGALGVVAASQGTMNNYIWGNERVQNYETICGGAGASAKQAGCDAVHTHMTNSRLTDPEVLEWRFPVRLESFSIRKNSGGKGLNKGGEGVDRRMRFLESMTVNMIAGHRVVPPYGLSGGGVGALGENYVIHVNGQKTNLGTKGQIEVVKGDIFVLKTPGGGGFGKLIKKHVV